MNMYTVIIKADNNRFVKYHNVTNLMALTDYIDKVFPSWRYFNVFCSKSQVQLASFTIKNRPQSKKIR